MSIPIDLVVYPLRDGTNLFASGRVSGLSPIPLSPSLVIALQNDILLKLGADVVYDAVTEQFSGHAYLYCREHITLAGLSDAFTRTSFSVSCILHTKANSLSRDD